MDENGMQPPSRETYADPNSEVMPGVLWGRPEWVPSAAFWRDIAVKTSPELDLFAPATSLRSETIFCLLGGYGITAELNCAAFQHLMESGVLETTEPAAADIEETLRAPLHVNGRSMRYRFPRQRATRIANALPVIGETSHRAQCPKILRTHLLTINGIGPKTASWIVRNCLNTDDVAILDIHIHRAGLLIGLFHPRHQLPRDYLEMEKRFLEFAQALEVRASWLDVIMWSTMRTLGVPHNLVKGGEISGQWRGQKQRRNNYQKVEAIQAAW